MKKIALVANAVALPGEKGLDRLAFLAELLTGCGYEVELITSRFQHWHKAFRSKEQVAALDLPYRVSLVEEIGYSKNIQLKRILSYRRLARNIKNHLYSNRYDLVHCLIPDNQIAAVAAQYAKAKNIPFLIDVEDLWPAAMRMVFDVPLISDLIFSYYTYYARKAYRLADGVIGSSDYYRDTALRYGTNAKYLQTVYVGNRLDAFDAGVRTHLASIDKEDGEFRVVYAGTLGTSYDIPTLIRAADSLKQQGVEQLHVVLLGDGPLRSDFEELAARLRGRVTFAGYVPFEVMAAHLVKADVTINSLVRKASQSIVSKIGDYLAAGKPMINTGLDPEFRAKVEADGFGINVEPENPEALAAAIRRLMDDPIARATMGAAARQIGEAQFDRPVSYQKIVAMIDRLLSTQH